MCVGSLDSNNLIDIYFTSQVTIKYMKKISQELQFLMTIAKVDAIISRKLNGGGLGFGDLAVLYAISQAPEGKIRRTDLADQVGLTASGVTRLLVPLEKIGVIKRESHERDARVSYTTMTKSGKELFEDSMKWIEEKCADLLPRSQTSNLSQATNLLEQLVK